MITHYIFVRNDLPVGVIAAMVTHAAGESAVLYAEDYDGRFRGATAVVLEASNETELDQIAAKLHYHEVQCVEIWESSGPYAKQLMAIGLVPIERNRVSTLLQHYKTLKSCLDITSLGSLHLENPNDANNKEADPQGPEGTPDMDCQSLLGLDSLLPESGCEKS